MNLDAIRRIGTEMGYVDEAERFDGVDERKQAIAEGFKSAYEKFSQPETSEETVEVPETESA
jgi:hypothetical protein